MNPKDLLDRRERMRGYGDSLGEYDRLWERLKAQQRAEATAALDDLNDALGEKLDGAIIVADLTHVSLPLDALRLIAARLTALSGANVLSDGAL